jgi:hypothetical protein
MDRLKALCWSFAAAGSIVCTLPTHAQVGGSPSDSSRAAAFDRLDRTSRMLIATVNCARSSAKARADGLFGPLDSIGRKGQCFFKDGRAFGVFFTSDSAFTRARQLGVVDIANGVRYLGTVDTTAILAVARAAQEAVLKGFPSFQRVERQFAPFAIRSEGDSIEVWLLPLGVLMGRTPSTVGGELGYVYSPDGGKLVREIDAFDRHRTFVTADSGRVEIPSREDDLPLVSELIAANRLHDQGRDVQLVTKAFAARLVGADPSSIWIQIRRR